MDTEATFRLFDAGPISYINMLSNDEVNLDISDEIRLHLEESSYQQKNIVDVYKSLLMIMDKHSIKLKENDVKSIMKLLNMYTYY